MRSRMRTGSGSGGPSTAESEYTGATLMPGTSSLQCSLSRARDRLLMTSYNLSTEPSKALGAPAASPRPDGSWELDSVNRRRGFGGGDLEGYITPNDVFSENHDIYAAVLRAALRCVVAGDG